MKVSFLWRAAGVMSLLAVLCNGCAPDDVGDVPDQEASESVGEAASSSEEMSVDESASALSSNGCSIVEWCNAPGAEGSVCRQKGCSRSAAIAECRKEIRQICGALTCPAIFKTPNGNGTDLCQCSNCS